MTTTSKTLGAKVQTLRSKRGMSIRELARRAQVDSTWASRVELGRYLRPDPVRLRRVAEVLGIEASELFMAVGYEDGKSLPKFAPYLREKYELSDDAIAQLEAHFRLLNEREQGGRHE